MSHDLYFNFFTVQQILTQAFGMKKVCVKMVPNSLMNEHKNNRKDASIGLLDHVERSQNPSAIKHWPSGPHWKGVRILQPQVANHGFFEYDPEAKRQSQEWHTANFPLPRKARMSKYKMKSILICISFTVGGVVRKELEPPGQSGNEESPWKTQNTGDVCDQALHTLGCFSKTIQLDTRQSPSMNF